MHCIIFHFPKRVLKVCDQTKLKTEDLCSVSP